MNIIHTSADAPLWCCTQLQSLHSWFHFSSLLTSLPTSPQMVQMQRTIAERKCQSGNISFHISMYLVSWWLTMTYKNIYNNAWCRTSSVFHDNLDNDNDLWQPLPLAILLYFQYKLVVSLLVGFQHNRLMAFISPAALLMITIPLPQDGHHVSGTFFSPSEADGNEQRHIHLVSANTQAPKPRHHPSQKSVVCQPLFPTFWPHLTWSTISGIWSR